MDSDSRGASPPPHTDMSHPKKKEWIDGQLLQDGKDEEEEDEEEEGVRRVKARLKVKRERRQGSSSSATMCQVCNMRLNSNAQAQIHYRGKTHQRRLRRLAKAVGASALTQNQVHPLLGPLPLPGRPLQPQTHPQLEHFRPLRVNGSSPLSLFPNFNAMDPIQKAVINHTFGMAQTKKKPVISCNICHLRFNSTTQAEAHYKGHKHARKLKALENQKNRQKSGHSQSSTGKDREGVVTGGATAPMDSQLKDRTDSSAPSQSVHPENSQENPQTTTPSSLTSSTDSSSLPSAHEGPQVSLESELSDLPSNSPHSDWCSPETGSVPHADLQGSSAGGEEEDETMKVKEAEEAKHNKKHLHCPTCKVTVNSNSQLESHCGGSKHKQMLNGQNSNRSHRRVKVASSPRPKSRIKPRIGSKSKAVVGVTNQAFHCKLCQVSVNSETQLKQHLNSRRHKERLAGKPVKAKFTPYNKLYPNAILATKLALQKQLSKALPAGLLTSPLSPAALCTMTSGPLALRLPLGPSAIIQSPLISPTLFRPAPGPLRATHAPIIFSPY